MPNIKKAFTYPGVLCYKCGKPIPVGTYDWSYNTQTKGLFTHSTCNSQITQNPPKPLPSVAPKPTKTCKICNREIVTPQGQAYEYDFDIHGYVHTTCKPVKKPEVLFHSNFATIHNAVPHSARAKKSWSPDISDRIVIDATKHKIASQVKRVLRVRRYPLLYGSPGAGKTHLAQQLAADMSLPFVLESCVEDMFKSELLGSRSPLSGQYFSTAFRECWQNGGVVLMDECAMAAGSFLNVLNAAMEQRILKFADEVTVPMHPNFFWIFADNSTLYGNDPMYPERKDAGGAFRDRLTYLHTDYDEPLELMVLTKLFDGDSSRAKHWHSAVLKIRKELDLAKIPIFASPRFAYKAVDWFNLDFTFDEIMSMELFRGQTDDIVAIAKKITDKYKGTY